ncbi:hypothetical protein GlitD10_0280 [Gloeomargarita lithophora Alchichica-D10]|uniref:DUF2330 domain-containing protein n=1 Tax=Gloeomargarita lithophora Alchichica-D10 TaxID=1188229 RepID=A0A1J0A9I5_9CYAN|nr:DUF2330 domain-containing protein [Gloeomargarita lithophora]APB32583.1 hypothetical protein GlitD10_0280 [Gloeomargarita lithophora Alchichica-D10]
MNWRVLWAGILCFWLGWMPWAWGFCGFFVAQADAQLFNNSSQVVIARQGTRTVVTLANDYQGDVRDFALVVPVPTVINQDQVRLGDRQAMQRLDSFSAPRLVEYFDNNPCQVGKDRGHPLPAAANLPRSTVRPQQVVGVTIEAQFAVGEYDIVVLSAQESASLERWLRANRYRIPEQAQKLLQPYIRQGMKFFVAKVNLKELEKSESQLLRPLLVAYDSPKFMLPIRLGMANSPGEQDVIVYLLSPRGRAEVTNYRTVRIPSNIELPVAIKPNFGVFYQTMFNYNHRQEGRKAVWLEYAWDMGWCDPCAANPLTGEELEKLGVFWLDGQEQARAPQGTNVYLTRLHLRTSAATFPEDLKFQETSNRENFQGRYILRHAYKGTIDCPDGFEYQQMVNRRQEEALRNLIRITGWSPTEAELQLNPDAEVTPTQPWWRRVIPAPTPTPN